MEGEGIKDGAIINNFNDEIKWDQFTFSRELTTSREEMEKYLRDENLYPARAEST